MVNLMQHPQQQLDIDDLVRRLGPWLLLPHRALARGFVCCRPVVVNALARHALDVDVDLKVVPLHEEHRNQDDVRVNALHQHRAKDGAVAHELDVGLACVFFPQVLRVRFWAA